MGIEYEKLCKMAKRAGIGVGAIAASRLPSLEEGYDDIRWQSSPVIQRYLENFSFRLPDGFAEEAFLLVVAVPVSISLIQFVWKGEKRELLLPPTYLVSEARQQVEELFSKTLDPAGFSRMRASVPVKYAAVKSGLARYGRNNIAYMPGAGSFVWLEAYFSDLPCPDGFQEETPSLDTCQSCRICEGKCPTGVIGQENLRIDASRCLTYFNECQPVFPEWVEREWHHALFGCMRCQESCPENRDHLQKRLLKDTFDEGETRQILKGVFDELPDGVKEKLAAYCRADDFVCFSRNLCLLLDAR